MKAVRAVATAAVRDASNQHEFIARASAALGTDVEIISGQEEARLIHLGVKSRWPHPKERFLIIDIGGGSAEIILSENERIGQAFSKPLGRAAAAGIVPANRTRRALPNCIVSRNISRSGSAPPCAASAPRASTG